MRGHLDCLYMTASNIVRFTMVELHLQYKCVQYKEHLESMIDLQLLRQALTRYFYFRRHGKAQVSHREKGSNSPFY